MANIKIEIASVKVMRSYDYCHFEVSLSSSVDCSSGSAEWFQMVDNLRKNAARLVDKAVDQYMTAKRARENAASNLAQLRSDAYIAQQTPESERTPQQSATIKAMRDAEWRGSDYDYEDDYQDKVR